MSGNKIEVGDLAKRKGTEEIVLVENVDYVDQLISWGVYPYTVEPIELFELYKSNHNRQKEANARMENVNVKYGIIIGEPPKFIPTTEGTKKDTGKEPISYIPSEFILGIANVFAFGAKKYSANNFRLGMAHSRVLDAASRHILAILKGEEIDPESGLPHIYHAGCSLAMYDYMRLHHPEKCDIFEINKKKEKGANDQPK